MVEVVLADAEVAFRPLSPVKFNIDRLETNPALRGDHAARERRDPGAAAHRHGGPRRHHRIVVAYATIEPIRDVLLQMFMGEKFGRDPVWEGHLATEIGQADISVEAVLYESEMPLKQLMSLDVGDTLTLELKPDALVTGALRRRGADRRPHGRVGDKVAVRVVKPLRKPKTTFAMFEMADQSSKPMDAP
jgi:flagellar motor switch protein FliM